ncbi:MAG: hypothetical protein Ta2G_01800 [Termitinemataceae bacterium]|nr:MAG: hypothetical protein Ta2G_01800 [Termitinemataceae bacterium]
MKTTKKLRKKPMIRMFSMVLTFFVSSVILVEAQSSKTEPTSVGYITLSDRLPEWNVMLDLWLTTTKFSGTPNSEKVYGDSENTVAIVKTNTDGLVDVESKIPLFAVQGKTFDPNGTYTIFVYMMGKSGYGKYQNSVKFTNGEAKLNFDKMNMADDDMGGV